MISKHLHSTKQVLRRLSCKLLAILCCLGGFGEVTAPPTANSVDLRRVSRRLFQLRENAPVSDRSDSCQMPEDSDTYDSGRKTM